MKKDTLWRLARLLVILLGIGILVYPSLSEYLSELNGSRATASYDDSVLQLEQDRLDQLLAQAQEYNRQLAGTSTGKAPLSDDEGNPITPESYWDLLNVDSAGMMGYIEIPKLNTTIPIYHGTSEAVLQVGVGHLQNTSLPVGGESTHAALSGHRGLPTRSLFTDLDQMEVGDRFYIKVLNETLCYTVDQILTVLPHEMDALAIEEGKDYVTLITCTPYGINSHRLLVRGVRTPYDPQQHQNEIAESTSYLSSMPAQYRHLLIGVVVLVAVLLLRFLVCAVLNIRKRRKHQHE
ncbi:class C sortase [Allofournierella massiliensis]|uniref:class C sortase n=1 Tax=Allofournierella massiliensis TaxID=1650663 RepID=UPI0035697CBA